MHHFRSQFPSLLNLQIIRTVRKPCPLSEPRGAFSSSWLLSILYCDKTKRQVHWAVVVLPHRVVKCLDCTLVYNPIKINFLYFYDYHNLLSHTESTKGKTVSFHVLKIISSFATDLVNLQDWTVSWYQENGWTTGINNCNQTTASDELNHIHSLGSSYIQLCRVVKKDAIFWLGVAC